ncbi:Hypothetical_protein [Hexamita inflata]|uniref:Hypothetical_protein n=1 Tax=Hexamita inflata TaxID=28002 RepID=A0AA86ND20_9EUKA|nr:Hypothetical protein HINF_LOCUS5202 [Hexamita inflata]CAI9917559.1 Hypothetical protein HINF_LOCUS5204 [Hexamita inflata]
MNNRPFIHKRPNKYRAVQKLTNVPQQTLKEQGDIFNWNINQQKLKENVTSLNECVHRNEESQRNDDSLLCFLIYILITSINLCLIFTFSDTCSPNWGLSVACPRVKNQVTIAAWIYCFLNRLHKELTV